MIKGPKVIAKVVFSYVYIYIYIGTKVHQCHNDIYTGIYMTELKEGDPL